MRQRSVFIWDQAQGTQCYIYPTLQASQIPFGSENLPPPPLLKQEIWKDVINSFGVYGVYPQIHEIYAQIYHLFDICRARLAATNFLFRFERIWEACIVFVRLEFWVFCICLLRGGNECLSDWTDDSIYRCQRKRTHIYRHGIAPRNHIYCCSDDESVEHKNRLLTFHKSLAPLCYIASTGMPAWHWRIKLQPTPSFRYNWPMEQYNNKMRKMWHTKTTLWLENDR